MTYNLRQHKLRLTENNSFSRKLLLREGILNLVKKGFRMYHGSDEPFDVLLGTARASRRENRFRLDNSRKNLERETKIARQQFLTNKQRLPVGHPERLENQFTNETGLPHIYTPVPYRRTAFDRLAAFNEIRADPATHAGGSTDPADWNRIINTRANQHTFDEIAREKTHDQNQAQIANERQKHFKNFTETKFHQHLDNIILSDYNHPLTSAKRIYDRDNMIYKLAYHTSGKLEKYRRLGDALRGGLSYYVGSSDSPAAKIANVIGHQLRSAGKQEELSPSGVSEPYSSGDSEHAPR